MVIIVFTAINNKTQLQLTLKLSFYYYQHKNMYTLKTINNLQDNLR